MLEVTADGTNALFLSVDEDRKLIFEKFIRNADLSKFLGSAWRRVTQKSWEGEYLFKKGRRKVIVSADPQLATTMPIPLDLVRDRTKWKDEITLTELENLIAQAMAKIFTQCRNEAAKRLGIDDIHTILVGAKTDRFRIDGHAVMNPIGFTSRKITVLLELTFTSRDEFFFMESPQAWLLSVARARELPLNLIAPRSGQPAPLFIFEQAKEGYPMLYREQLDWSFDRIFERIGEELGVSAETAKDLYQAYRNGEFSQAVERGFRRIVQPAVENLLGAVESADIKGRIYLDVDLPAPFDLPYKHKGATFEQLPLADIVAELDLNADPVFENASVPSHRMFRNLAPFFEAYFAKNTSEINQKLRRRLHWLA